MRIGSGENTYQWIDGWAKIPDSESARTGWAHHGIVVTESDDVISYHPGDPRVLIFDSEGNLKSSWDSGCTEGHGLTLVKEESTEYLWISDNGDKAVKEEGYELNYMRPPGSFQASGKVVKKALDGQTIMTLPKPEISIYKEGKYSPTAVAVNEERYGGNGDVWVSDGYGQNCVHRFDKEGNYKQTITGEEGAGSFEVPHGIWIDRRKPEPELCIGDNVRLLGPQPLTYEGSVRKEMNLQGRIQVYDLDGNFKRSFGRGLITLPRKGVATHEGFLIVPELYARVAVFDLDDNFAGYLDDNREAVDDSEWPNSRDQNGEMVRPNVLKPGRVHSPHDIAMDSKGNLYLSEYLIGGRITKLAKV